jgi:hypothetical protein
VNSLVEILAAHQQGSVGLEELLKALQSTRKEMLDHQKDISELIKDVPDFMVSVERASWLANFTEVSRLLKDAEDNIRDPLKVKALHEELPSLSEEMAGQSMALRECAWAARGPTVHGGVNELLYLLDQLEVDPTDEGFALVQAKIEVEFTRLENQAQLMEHIPEFMQVAMDELLPEYQTLLETAAVFMELEEEQAEEFMAQLEDWGISFGAYDLDFVIKRYSQMPTAIPSLNLALNSQLLFLDEVVVEDMVDYAVTTAVETLNSASDEFLKTPDLSDVVRHQYEELLDGMIDLLEGLPEIEDRDELREEGGKLVELTGKFVDVQGQSEKESGSRLDFKTD